MFILILVAPVANGKAKEESSDDDSSDDEEEAKPAPKVEAAKPAAKKEESSSDEDSSDEEEEKKPGMYFFLSFSKIKIGIFSNYFFGPFHWLLKCYLYVLNALIYVDYSLHLP